jgi:hypothetical protein
VDRTKRIPVRVTDDDHLDYHAAAKRDELDASEWLRQLADKRIGELERKGWRRPSQGGRGRRK